MHVAIHHFHTMVGTVVFLTFVPALVLCSGDGNIRLLQDEVIVALKACTHPNNNANPKEISSDRQRRSENSYDGSPKIDDNTKQSNRYSQETRNSNSRDQVQVLNVTDYVYDEHGSGDKEEIQLSLVPTSSAKPANTTRTKRSDPLLNKLDTDQCLSQCVFANLQVVDSHGIPREAELWNKVQSSVTSQQSRSALRDQIRACFQELQSEAEDNGCSYSNKLERCLMLRFSDRKADKPGSTTNSTSTK